MTQYDLSGKTALVTGATNGIGKEAAVELAGMGAQLILLARSCARAEATREEIAARTGNRQVEIVIADMASMAQVRQAAASILAMDRPIHVLLNNAGLMQHRRIETEDGFESTIAINHLAPFLLTNLLLDRIVKSAPARIVNVSSRAHWRSRGRIRLDDLHSKRGFDPWRVYGQSKLANILFTRELARRLEGTGVTVNCLHPGVVATGFDHTGSALFRLAYRIGSLFMSSPARGARTSIHLCAAPEVAHVTGTYFASCAAVEPAPQAMNDDDARALWQLSAELTGLASARQAG